MEDRQQWLIDRTKGIGGSDAPVILGISPYKTPYQLWQEKTGKIDIPDEDSPVIRRGRTMEPIIANMYAEVTGRTLKRVRGIQRHPSYPWLIGDFTHA